MTKKDLITGDIIVNRNGYLGVVLKEADAVLYQLIGSDSLDEFNDDLAFDDEDYRDGDIMQVYRDCNFLDVETDQSYPIYQRDFSWKRPTNEEIDAQEKALDEEIMKQFEEMKKASEEKKKDIVFIVAQHFYGNRTATEVSRAGIDLFLTGALDPEFLSRMAKTVDRKIVAIPNTDNIVVVYDQNQENEMIANGKTKYISCEIPQINLKLHSRCFACRIDENGELQSLEKGDADKFIDYFNM